MRYLLAMSLALAPVLASGQVVTKVTPEVANEAVAFAQTIAGAGPDTLPPHTGTEYTVHYPSEPGEPQHWHLTMLTPYSRMVALALEKARKLLPPPDTAALLKEVSPADRVFLLATIEAPERPGDDRPEVERIVVVRRGFLDVAHTFQPIAEKPLIESYQNALGTETKTKGAMAAFPFSVLTADNDIVVIFGNGSRSIVPLTESLLATIR